MKAQDAKRLSTSGTISIGELRTMIENARGKRAFSKVNKGIALETALDVYKAALGNRSDTDVPAGMVPDYYSPNGAGMKPSRDSVLIYNILRDCA